MKRYFLGVRAGMNHCCSSQRLLNILSFSFFPILSLLPLFMYLFISIYFLLHSSQTQSKAKKYIYVYMCCRQNTVNFTTATKQLLCHLNIRLRRRNGKTWGCHFFSLCILGQVCVCFISLVCALMKMIPREGWLNVQHTGASIIKLLIATRLNWKKKSEKMK